MTTTFTQKVTEKFHIVTCYSCGVAFAINNDLHRRAVVDKQGSVYCPSCGEQTVWTGKSNVEKVREEMQRKLNVANERAKRATKSLAATKGAITKIKNRVSKGVCPVPGCTRSFDSTRLERHIKSKHPDYLQAES